MPSAVLFSLLSFGSFFPCLLDPLFAHSSFLLDLQHCHIEHWVATVISSPQLKGKKGRWKRCKQYAVGTADDLAQVHLNK